VAIVSAIVSHILTLRVERVRWEREDRFRLHFERRKLYRQMRLKLDSAQRYPGEDFTSAYDEFSELEADIELIAPVEVVRAAKWASTAAQVNHARSREFSEKRTSGERAELAALELEEATAAFLRAARKDLGLPEETTDGSEESEDIV
jgi:hypothetical protein